MRNKKEVIDIEDGAKVKQDNRVMLKRVMLSNQGMSLQERDLKNLLAKSTRASQFIDNRLNSIRE